MENKSKYVWTIQLHYKDVSGLSRPGVSASYETFEECEMIVNSYYESGFKGMFIYNPKPVVDVDTAPILVDMTSIKALSIIKTKRGKVEEED